MSNVNQREGKHVILIPGRCPNLDKVILVPRDISENHLNKVQVQHCIYKGLIYLPFELSLEETHLI